MSESDNDRSVVGRGWLQPGRRKNGKVELRAPWRPMAEAPKDGSLIVVVYEDFSGVEVCFWGETVNEPHRDAWFGFTGDIGNFEDTDEAVVDDAYGWVPFPNDGVEHE